MSEIYRRDWNLLGKQQKTHMSKFQEKMRRNYDQRSKGRQFCKGEKVMTLLPTRKSPFDVEFKGPYMIAEKVDDLNYKINTPNRRQKTQLCHVQSYKKIFRMNEQIWDAHGANRHSQNRLVHTWMASDHGIGAVLSQHGQDGHLKPVGYFA